jgi:hypothetical protein
MSISTTSIFETERKRRDKKKGRKGKKIKTPPFLSLFSFPLQKHLS